MSSSSERSRLNVLLHEIYLKKRLLDTTIAVLEAALPSADRQFVESVAKALGDGRVRQPSTDLDERQRARLARLAQQVGRTRGRRVQTVPRTSCFYFPPAARAHSSR